MAYFRSTLVEPAEGVQYKRGMFTSFGSTPNYIDLGFRPRYICIYPHTTSSSISIVYDASISTTKFLYYGSGWKDIGSTTDRYISYIDSQGVMLNKDSTSRKWSYFAIADNISGRKIPIILNGRFVKPYFIADYTDESTTVTQNDGYITIQYAAATGNMTAQSTPDIPPLYKGVVFSNSEDWCEDSTYYKYHIEYTGLSGKLSLSSDIVTTTILSHTVVEGDVYGQGTEEGYVLSTDGNDPFRMVLGCDSGSYSATINIINFYIEPSDTNS